MSNVAEHHVAKRMAVFIIDGFHVIDIEHEQSARSAVTMPPFKLALQCHAEAAAVCESSQMIKVGFGAKLFDLLTESYQLMGAQDHQFSFCGYLEVIKRTHRENSLSQFCSRWFRT